MKKSHAVLLGFIILKFVLQYVLISPEYELHRDEFLHLDQAHHLSWGYLSVPPFSSWISLLILHLGNTVFWVRFFPALFGAMTIFITWKATETLGGSLYARILGATCVLFSAILRINLLYQPNSFDILCWTAMYFVLIKYFKTDNVKWLYGGGVVFAFGFLNKYNIAFLVIGLLPAVLLTRHRKMFAKKELYLAILLALLLISPNLIWQFQNDFPVIHHMDELARTQLANVNRTEFLKSQLLFFIGSLFVIAAGIYALFNYEPFSRYRPFLFALPFTLVAFIFFRAKDYYAVGIYPIYIAFGAVYLAGLLQSGWKKYLRPVAVLVPVAVFIPFVKLAFPLKSPRYITANPKAYKDLGLLRWEDGKDHALPQDFADMQGWKELASMVDDAYADIDDKNSTLILCDNYGQAGAINFYSRHNIRAVSFNADYINWFDFTRNYKNIIRIKEVTGSATEYDETSRYFQKAYVAGAVTNKYARECGTTIFVFVGAKVNVNKRVQQEIAQWKLR